MCTSFFYSLATAQQFIKIVQEKGLCGQDAVVLELVLESQQNDDWVGCSYCSFVLAAPLSDDAEQFCKAFKGWMPEDALC